MLEMGVVRAAKRHLIDTVGVMVAGANEDVACRAGDVLAALHAEGEVPVPGRARRADLLDAAFLGGVSAHGIELDDGYRQGSVHPGAVVVPVALGTAFTGRRGGRDLLAAIVAGYEVVTAIGRACHPHLRRQGFHPTAAVGAFGAAAAAATLRGAPRPVLANAIGIAASSAAGLFAFVNGGADVKRLHPGHAAREGLLAVLLAEQGVAGPPGVLEARDGFFQAFAGAAGAGPGATLSLVPDGRFGITDCYLKPYACCRHIHPAIDALLRIVSEQHVRPGDVASVQVETYRIAAEHAEVGWDDFASAQLSFKYALAIALLHGAVDLDHFSGARRADPAIAEIVARIQVAPSAELDALYPAHRPARVTLRVGDRSYVRQTDEALGSPEMPLDDAAVHRKFTKLTGPVLGSRAADELLGRLWEIDAADDVAPVIELSVPRRLCPREDS
jgi:2-methylcitrate dehydratase PrpD